MSAAGTPLALPITSSAAPASSSATAITVASRRRPRASAVPRRSSSGCDAGDADGHVGRALAPGAAEGVADDHRGRDAEAGGERLAERRAPTRRDRAGRSTTQPSPGVFERSTPALAQTKPCSVSAMTRSSRRRRTARASRRITSRWSSVLLDAALGLRDDLLGDDEHVAVLAVRRRDSTASPRRPARSSPGRTSGIPARGTTCDHSGSPVTLTPAFVL